MSSLFHRKTRIKVLPINISNETSTNTTALPSIPSKSRTKTRNPITALASWWRNKKLTRKAAKAINDADMKALEAELDAMLAAEAEVEATEATEEARIRNANRKNNLARIEERNKAAAQKEMRELTNQYELQYIKDNKRKELLEDFKTYCHELIHIYPNNSVEKTRTRNRTRKVSNNNNNKTPCTDADKKFKELYAIYLKNFNLHWDNKLNDKDREQIALFKPNIGFGLKIKSFSDYIQDINIKIQAEEIFKGKITFYTLFWDMEKFINLVNKSKKLIWYGENNVV